MDRGNPATMTVAFDGIGMTSRRTRERLIKRLQSEGVQHREILDAIREVPRHIFVDEALASRAYEDIALPIGAGQTISQPYIVARMTESLLGGEAPKRVLEVGTGCGYQTAILARLVERVYSVERIASLLTQARERLHALRIHNVRMQHRDGGDGWPEHATYDGILVAAAPAGIPPKLMAQLATGGRMVIPIGERDRQRLMLITRTADGFEESVIEHVSFVPMLSGIG